MARPAQQWDPDQYLHVVERRPDGVVVRGAKIHNTIAPYADELIVTPTRMMGPDEGDWAISFAIPADTEGVYMICRQAAVEPRPDNVSAPVTNISDIESMTVFDNVFIPNERIFLNGETDFAGPMALTFALYHRHSYTGCKPGIGDMLIGTTALMAEYNNIRKQSHVKEKLVDLISVAELVYAAGIAAAYKSHKAASGTQVPDVTYANVGRRHAAITSTTSTTFCATSPAAWQPRFLAPRTTTIRKWATLSVSTSHVRRASPPRTATKPICSARTS